MLVRPKVEVGIHLLQALSKILSPWLAEGRNTSRQPSGQGFRETPLNLVTVEMADVWPVHEMPVAFGNSGPTNPGGFHKKRAELRD